MAPGTELHVNHADHASKADSQTLHGILEKASKTNPEKICLKMYGKAGLTYAQVHTATELCASYVVLFQSDVVLLVADRSYGMMLSMLGIMRAGKAYCPVEPDYPASRVRAMIQVSRLTAALVPKGQVPQEVLDTLLQTPVMDNNDDGSGGFKRQMTPMNLSAYAIADDGHIFDYHDISKEARSNPKSVPASISDDTTAYVLFTSGSTGRPKGCSVPHRGSALYAKAVAEVCNTDADMVFLLKTPYVFDVHVQDIYSAFAVGATLVMAEPAAHRDASAVADTIIQERINVACFVPTLLVEFVNYLASNPEDVVGVRTHLRRVLCIGEALMSATCRQLLELVPGVEIHNLYGPTEASVGVSHYQATKESLGNSTVAAIGKPFNYVDFRVMQNTLYEDSPVGKETLRDVPDGEIGELWIAGDCLAHGYLNDPERTNDAFFHIPSVQERPARAASAFGLYKTGDLVKVKDGIFEYCGRCDFQVKIGGVRIECEEVASVLKTHAAVSDALVCAFEGPFGKALAAYIVADPTVDWRQQVFKDRSGALLEFENAEDGEEAEDLVSKWGAVYDEMYQDSGEGVSDSDPTLNWSGYVDTYSRHTHVESVIAEWVHWSCELVLRHQDVSFPSANAAELAAKANGQRRCVVELGCGNGMLLFRIAPVVAKAVGGCYIATDISTAGLSYVQNILAQHPKYKGLPVETKKIAAHETLDVCDPATADVILCNGVTMYFPSSQYLIECMQTAVQATKDGGFVIFGDIQSKRHLMPFHVDVQTFQALRRPDATPLAVLRAARKAAATEQLSYYDDALFHRLENDCNKIFNGRVARVELRLKRGWWHSEFNRFRYDVELVVGEAAVERKPLKLERRTYKSVCDFLKIPCIDELAVNLKQIEDYVSAMLSQASSNVDGFVVSLPNSRMLGRVRLLAWLEQADKNGQTLKDLPYWMRPLSVELGGSPDPSLAKYGVEPEALFELQAPKGWTQRVIWAESPEMMDLVLLRDAAAQQPWLNAVRNCGEGPLLTEEMAGYKNDQADYQELDVMDGQKACHDALRAWTMNSSLLPAMRPLVYVSLDEFPKNQAGKTDRGKLPDARAILDKVSDAAVLAFEAPATDEETKMAALWQEVLKMPVSVSTPFLAYGVNSLVALKLCSKILAAFGDRPDIAFLMSEDCTVRGLVRKLTAQAKDKTTNDSKKSLIVRLSPENRKGMYLLIVGAAGTSSMTYQPIVEHFAAMQVFAVEYPGRGMRAEEPSQTDFAALFAGVLPDVVEWAQGKNFVMWGDSLGAVLAYEIIVHVQSQSPESSTWGVVGLCVSGNAGPTEAARERGMGESVKEYLGKDVKSVSEMSDDDWTKFFLAANKTEDGATGLEDVFKDEEMRRQALDPLIADCYAYESYKKCSKTKIRCAILTVRGSKDLITAPGAMASWSQVAGGEIEHHSLPGVGHMIVHEAPRAMAKVIENELVPDFSSALHEYRSYRKAYSRQRSASSASTSGMGGYPIPLMSPTLGVSRVPKDLDDSAFQLEFSVLEDSEVLTPATSKVKQMRLGNAKWRLGLGEGRTRGNQLNMPL